MQQIQQLNTNRYYQYRRNNCSSVSTSYAANCTGKDVVSFSSRPKDLLELPQKEIFKKLEESISGKHFIGAGREARVYKIPDTHYVLRLEKVAHTQKAWQGYKKNFTFDLTEQDKINHTVAKLGGESRIMKHIEGVNCFRYKNQKELFNLPLKSYYDLYKQLCYAKNNDMVFDSSASNIIYNPKDRSLTAIDFYKQDFDYPENVTPLASIFSAFTSTSFLFQPQNFSHLLASLLNVVLEESAPKKIPAQPVTDIALGKLFKNFESCYEDTLPPQYNILKKTMYSVVQLKYEEQRGKDVTVELNGKIKLANSLIKQVLRKDNNSFLSKLKLLNREIF